MSYGDPTYDYVHFADATPETILAGLRETMNMRIEMLARKVNLTSETRAEAFIALNRLFEQQQVKLAQTDKDDPALPEIDYWWFARRPFERFIIVVGEVKNHALLPDGPICTSPLYHWDQDRNLVATQNTIYRMKVKMDLAQAFRGP